MLEGSFDVRVSAVEQSAAGGDPKAQRILGNMYYWGEYVEQSEAKATAWWSRAADKSDADAQLNLARVSARQAVQGVMHASVGREMWNSVEEEYFAAMDDFETMVLPSQDAALGENPDAEEDPSVMEKILSPIGKALQDAVSAIAGS